MSLVLIKFVILFMVYLESPVWIQDALVRGMYVFVLCSAILMCVTFFISACMHAFSNES